MSIIKVDYGELAGGNTGYYSDFTPTINVTSEFDVGFTPTKVFVWCIYANRTILLLEHDVSDGRTYEWYDTYVREDDQSSFFSDWFSVQGTKVKYTPKNSYYISKTWIVVI